MIRAFPLGERRGVAFHGGFIQEFLGFSDFSLYAPEIIMICGLADYLRDESVFPALTTKTNHFTADLILFGHTGDWKQVRLGKVDFINVGNIGALAAGEEIGYGDLAREDQGLEG